LLLECGELALKTSTDKIGDLLPLKCGIIRNSSSFSCMRSQPLPSGPCTACAVTSNIAVATFGAQLGRHTCSPPAHAAGLCATCTCAPAMSWAWSRLCAGRWSAWSSSCSSCSSASPSCRSGGPLAAHGPQAKRSGARGLLCLVGACTAGCRCRASAACLACWDPLLTRTRPALPQDLTPRAKDSLVSFGERLSTRIFASFLRSQAGPGLSHERGRPPSQPVASCHSHSARAASGRPACYGEQGPPSRGSSAPADLGWGRVRRVAGRAGSPARRVGPGHDHHGRLHQRRRGVRGAGGAGATWQAL
jgi:hypothetical protein